MSGKDAGGPNDEIGDGLDEMEEFSAAMHDVVPLDSSPTQYQTAPQVTTRTHLQRRAAAVGADCDLADPNFLTLADVPAKQPLEVLEWRKDGVQLAVFNKLRRGGYALEANLDLHRKVVKEARQLVFSFIKQAQAKGQRSVLFTPGKGEFSATPGRLKSYLAAWLVEHPEIIAFCSATKQHGGVGSVYALIRKSPIHREENRELHGQKSS